MRVILLISVMFNLSACSFWSDQASEMRMEIKSYKVPVANAEVLRKTLSSFRTSTSEQVIGGVKLIGGDQLVVAAPRYIHEDIKQLISQLNKKVENDTSTTYKVEYWFAAAADTPINNYQEITGEVADAVKLESKKAHIHLVDHVEYLGASPSSQEIESRHLLGQSSLVAEGHKINMATKLRLRGIQGRIEGNIKMDPNKYLVLAGIQHLGTSKNIKDGDLNSHQLYLVARVTPQ